MNYVIVTPAYNEEKYIGKMIDSVLAQAIRPAMWVIVETAQRIRLRIL